MTFEEKENLSEEDLALLNSKLGLRHLFLNKKIDIPKTLRQLRYELELQSLQVELVKTQSWVIENKERVVVLFAINQ